MQSRAAYRNFEQSFDDLLEQAKAEPITMQTILTTLSGRGKILVLIFLSLGFAQIPGIAVALGLFISYLGIRISMERSFVWCPKFLLRKKIPSYFLIKVLNQILQMLHFIKRWSKPRYEWADQALTDKINGGVFALVGVCMASSPPVPLTGILASLAIFLIAIGYLNHDGLYIAFGYIFAFSYFVMVLVLLKYFSFTGIIEWCVGLFS